MFCVPAGRLHMPLVVVSVVVVVVVVVVVDIPLAETV